MSTSAVKRKRRRVSRVVAPAVTPKIKGELAELCDEHVACRVQVNALNDRMAAIEEKAGVLAAVGNLTKFHTALADMTYLPTKGRRSTTIDPVKLRDWVGDDTFVKCVNVVAKNAKKYVTQADLDKVSTTTPAKDGPPKVVIKPRTK